jgi:hypothetical protein
MLQVGATGINPTHYSKLQHWLTAWCYGRQIKVQLFEMSCFILQSTAMNENVKGHLTKLIHFELDPYYFM